MGGPVFWAHDYGWFLFTGSLVFGASVLALAGYFSSESHERRQKHKFSMRQRKAKMEDERELLRLRLEYASRGMDPDYVAMLEKKARDETGQP